MLGFIHRCRVNDTWLPLLGCLIALASGCDDDAVARPGDESSLESDSDTDESSDGSSDDDDDDVAAENVDAGTRDGSIKAPRDGGKPDAARLNGTTDAGSTKGSPDAGRDAAQRDSSTPRASADGAVPEPSTATCGLKLPPIPDDPLAKGPWDTGVRTAKIGRLTVELFYPAKIGSTAGKEEVFYDARQWLPAAERQKVSDEHAHFVYPTGGHLYRDVAIDDESGPFPVVVFIHGTASHRAASATTNKHWASRGFVVLAADYPGLGLGDQMASTLECLQPTTGAQDIPGDVKAQLAALTNPSGDLAFLKGRIDPKALAISGHSQGGCMTAALSNLPDVKLAMPISGSTPVSASPTLASILYVSGMIDTVIGYDFPLIGNTVCPIGSSDSLGAFNASPGPPKVKKRLVGIAGGGHLSVTDLCEKNKAGRTSVDELQAAGVCGVSSAVIIGLPALFDCGTIDYKKGVEAVNYVTTAALEETLHCRDRTRQFAELRTAVPQVGDFKEGK